MNALIKSNLVIIYFDKIYTYLFSVVMIDWNKKPTWFTYIFRSIFEKNRQSELVRNSYGDIGKCGDKKLSSTISIIYCVGEIIFVSQTKTECINGVINYQ